MGSNAGEDLLKLIIKALWFVIKLLPRLFKAIFKGIKAIINMIKSKQTAPSETE